VTVTAADRGGPPGGGGPFRPRDVTSWGRVARARHRVARPRFSDELGACLAPGAGDGGLLAVGLGRSYGDSGLNAERRLIDMAGLDRLVAFDAEAGILRADAGLSLDDLLGVTVPRGWFLPTTPGTRYVTLGGAVANDVHGKNHHSAGSLGCAVREIALLRTDGTRRRPRPGDPLFAATIGGLGLTGVITEVELSLAPIGSAYLDVERLAFGDVAEFFAVARDSAAYEHTVAWVDCTAGAGAPGRGVFSRGSWRSDGRLEPHDRAGGPALPVDLPQGLLNRRSVALFNALYRRLQLRRPAARVEHYAPFFYPLDGLRQWNRLYGRAGFYQYQCVVPPDAAEAAVAELLGAIAASGEGSFLAVLKTFGPRRSEGLVSFPMEGATLALDFANRGARTHALLGRLDNIVAGAGGRLYPAKDGRMPAAMFQAGYPEWRRLGELKDPGLCSDFWRRVSTE
jgi:FAD/FMN-containing dehydrogenase